MHKYLALAAAAALGITALGASASAQSVGIYVGPSGGGVYSYDYYGEPGYAPYAYGPRVYGYTRPADDVYGDDVRVRRTYRSGGCGTFRYWNGDRCVDAGFER